MTSVSLFHIKVKVKGKDLGHYPAKLLKRFRFSQNVFTFFKAKNVELFTLKNALILFYDTLMWINYVDCSLFAIS